MTLISAKAEIEKPLASTAWRKKVSPLGQWMSHCQPLPGCCASSGQPRSQSALLSLEAHVGIFLIEAGLQMARRKWRSIP